MKRIEKEQFDNNSPWIKSLKPTRAIRKLEQDEKTDILIVGAGIAGVLTSYFLLKNTKQKIILVDKNLAAHGATGHNAGQVVDYFERSIKSIVEEYEIKMAIDAEKELISCWSLLKKIIKKEDIKAKLSLFKGKDFYKNVKVLNEHIEDELILNNFGIKKKSFYYTADMDYPIGKKTIDIPKGFVGCSISKKGLMNSAAFSEELISILLSKFKKRFSLFENTEITAISFGRKNKAISVHDIVFKKIVLCTNGFEHFTPIKDFNKKVFGVVGYMAGYFKRIIQSEDAISYYDIISKSKLLHKQEPYIYVTKRKFIHNRKKGILVCAGGPEFHLRDKELYDEKKNYIKNPVKLFKILNNKLDFVWHGLMGYTYNGLRIVGKDSKNPRLYYNLGCNGAGILTSLLGAKMIGDMFKGKRKRTIFDPK